MRISKWHVTIEGPKTKGARRARRRSTARAVEEHWILVDGTLYELLEYVAAKRRTTVGRIVDTAINQILDSYGVA